MKKWPAHASLLAEGPNFLKWLAWYQISQSGMLPEAYSDVTEQDPGGLTTSQGAVALYVWARPPIF